MSFSKENARPPAEKSQPFCSSSELETQDQQLETHAVFPRLPIRGHPGSGRRVLFAPYSEVGGGLPWRLRAGYTVDSVQGVAKASGFKWLHHHTVRMVI
eukprot:COSAG02_NODE_76_length_41115_cov_60.967817_30_plen_99_part_00